MAAAIECGATTIVTGNVRDFPRAALAPFGIRVVKPDDFALAGIDANPVLAVRPVLDAPDSERFLLGLAKSLPRTTIALRRLID